MPYFTDRGRGIGAGSLDGRALGQWVTIEARSQAQDSAGQRVDEWERVVACPARVRPLSGGELLAAQAAQVATTIEVTLRYRRGIDASMRVLYNGRRLVIDSIADSDEAHRWLVLRCSEGDKLR